MTTTRAIWVRGGVISAVLISTPLARADVPARALVSALVQAGIQSPVRSLPGDGTEARLPLLIESTTPPAEAVRVMDGVYFLRRPVLELEALLAPHAELKAYYRPSLRPMLDRADDWVSASAGRAETGVDGDGVFVGIVDTGFDIRHPDLRHPDGSTRVGWLIDFSEGPEGVHPELEEQYGCTSQDLPCRILDAEALNQLLTNSVIGDEPKDRRGHGTHVASLAAGSADSQDPPLYQGVAPAATLALAQVLGADGSIDEASVLQGTRFIFERAAAENAAAAVNISLGTDFGAHDGSSLVERSLASFVGENHPGRVLLVAAGNSAAQTRGLTEDYPEPLGVHTEVHVPRGASVTVPVLTLASDPDALGSVFAWIQSRPGDHLRIGFDAGVGGSIRWVDPGDTRAYAFDDSAGDFDVTVANSPSEPDAGLGVSSGSAAVVISGQWKQGRSFVLHFEGQGTAQIWIEGAGALGPGGGGGVFLPRSTKEGTITIPASDPNLIAVGATLNRADWPSESDEAMNLVPALDVPLDSVTYFSSAGPNSLGALKPELVAPGAYVVGAMSRDADPREDPFSVFASAACSDRGCRVVDDEHAVGSGTSMAAPLVTGASALLLQRDPTLTAPRIRALLMAGSRVAGGSIPAAQQAGAGVLDVIGSLRVQDQWANEAESETATPDPEHTRLVLASSFVRPDPAWPLNALLLLRDADDSVSDPAKARVQLVAQGAASSKFERIAPGLWQLSVAAPADAGGKTLGLRVLVDEALVATRDVRVAVDPAVASAGFSARGGCALARGDAEPNPWWLVLVWVATAAWLRRNRTGSVCRSSAAV